MNPLRNTCIARARNDVQDCLVVGAGINGAVAAAALSGKGAKVTVIDKADFASCTSQESSNLAWGGIKYLESYEFPLVWNLCKSRNHLMEAYPSQVQEISFFTSIAKGFRKPRFIIYLGAVLYWLMGRCQTRPPRLLSVSKINKEEPMVKTDGLAGGLEYSDCCFSENDARFTFGFIDRVLHKGGNAINYLELIGAEWKNGLWQCAVRDQVSGDAFSINARTLVNAAGPFVDRINTMLRIESRFKHVFSKGVHIIVPRITRIHHVLTFFATDGRLFFMIPMADRTCIGTTDTRTDNESVLPEPDDVQFLIDNANALLNLQNPLRPEDVIAKRCGVRPLVVKADSDTGHVEWTELSRKHEIDIHPDKKMCSIYGGKLTDCINVGEEVADIIGSFGISFFQTLKQWYGEPSPRKQERFREQSVKIGLKEEEVSRLWRIYGAAGFRCLEKMQADPNAKQKVLEEYSRAELETMAEQEMVIHLSDFLRRRTRIALTLHRASLRCHPGLPKAAEILFRENAEAEIERYFSDC